MKKKEKKENFFLNQKNEKFAQRPYGRKPFAGLVSKSFKCEVNNL